MERERERQRERERDREIEREREPPSPGVPVAGPRVHDLLRDPEQGPVICTTL